MPRSPPDLPQVNMSTGTRSGMPLNEGGTWWEMWQATALNHCILETFSVFVASLTTLDGENVYILSFLKVRFRFSCASLAPSCFSGLFVCSGGRALSGRGGGM
jgi:hypothetical protein